MSTAAIDPKAEMPSETLNKQVTPDPHFIPTQPTKPSPTKPSSHLTTPPPADSHPTPWSLPTSTSEPPLHHPIPTKPRSSSQLHSSRPAPPSPAPSRPSSQIMSPNPNLAPSSWTRDRAGSTSSRSGRRGSGTVSRASSKPRPRSTLGTSSVVPSSSGADTSTIPSETSHSQNHSLATTPIPEHSPSLSPYPPELIIRDYAYLPTDARHRTLPIPHPSPQPSSSCFGFPDLGSSSSGKKGWGGFNLLSWRGFMGNSSKRESADSSISSQPPNPDDDHEYPLTTDTDNDDDDFAFSSTSSDDVEGEGDEPYGLYRAAYAFDAMGEHEIGLEEGDYVEVRGRGGGEGWVVAIRRKVVDGVVVGREEGGLEREGLVPESYLERANNLGGEGEMAGEAEDEGGVED